MSSLHKPSFDILSSLPINGRVVGGSVALSRESAWCKCVQCVTRPFLWWRLHEQMGSAIQDYSGNARHGTPGADWLSRRHASFGLGGRALNSANGSVTGGNWNTQSPMTAITVGCWIRWDALTNAGLVAKWNTSYAAGGDWSLGKVSTRLRFNLGTAGLYAQGPVMTEDPYWNGWHWWVATYSGAASAPDRVKLYYDGNPIAVTIVGGLLPASVANTTNVIVAGRLGTYYWDGGLDEVVIWPVALTAAQIAGIWKYVRKRK